MLLFGSRSWSLTRRVPPKSWLPGLISKFVERGARMASICASNQQAELDRQAVPEQIPERSPVPIGNSIEVQCTPLPWKLQAEVELERVEHLV